MAHYKVVKYILHIHLIILSAEKEVFRSFLSFSEPSRIDFAGVLNLQYC